MHCTIICTWLHSHPCRYPPTPLPYLRGRRKGSVKHWPPCLRASSVQWEHHRIFGQPVHVPTEAFIGHHPVHAAVSHACSPATLAAVTCLWSGWCPTMLPRAVTSTQPMPAKASSPTHPPLLLAGSKVLNGTGSADQVATRWAWILLGFCCFGCVPTRWKMHPGRREEVSAPPTQAFIGHHPVHAAVSHACSPATLAGAPRCCPGPLRQPNQCLPKLPAPPIHLCF